MFPGAIPNRPEADAHLSEISTAWTVVNKAHGASAGAAETALQELLQRYQLAVHRYLFAAVRDANIAVDLFQEFALRLVRGDFKRADPQRGRFRDYLKASLSHLIVDYHRSRGKWPQPLDPQAPAAAMDEPSQADPEAQFTAAWKATLIERAWATLEEEEKRSGQPLYTILRYRSIHPEARSAQMAEHFATQFEKAVTPGWVRKRLWAARDKFKEYLVEEVARSLEAPTPAALAEELSDLGLLVYCQEALDKRRT